MGSKKNMVEILKERCMAVDWEVTMGGGGHWKVKTHTGKIFSIAGSSSDVHGMKNAERRAIRHGLAQREQEYALAREKERLERLEQDRAKGVDWEAEEKKIEEQKKILGYVDGVAVLERVPARAAHPRSPGKIVDIKHGVELGLEDGTVIFECVHPVMVKHKYQDCGRRFDTANSLRSHIAWHNRQVGNEEETAAILADEDTMQAITEAEAEEYVERVVREDDVDELDVLPQPVVQPGIFVRLSELAREIDDLVDDAAELTESIRVKRNEFRKLIAELPQHLADGDLRAKARKYDAMMEAAGQ